MNRLACLLLVPCLGACSLIDAATSERPDGRQSEALGDIFVSIGSFVAVADDPAAADTGDLADMHAITAYQLILDPDGAPAARASVTRQPLDGCTTKEANSASWNCSFTLNGEDCTAVGSGTRTGETVSGSSTMTCGALAVTVTAADVQFDEAAGSGSGDLTVAVANPALAGWATVSIQSLGFCTGEANVLPNTGRVVVDGEGPLDGLPFDPLTLKFQDDPACGTALIE
ncbi:MAG: hypothetical protein ABI867_08670 [Kofleriaceae bacterium]